MPRQFFPILLLLSLFWAKSAFAVSCTANGSELAACAVALDQHPIGTNMYDAKVIAMVNSYTGFVEGITLTTLNRYWCPNGERFQIDMLYAVVSKFLRDHPEQWNDQPTNLVIKGLAAAFPCKRGIK
jgi:hypothetical protein